jgi:hypothetical protein
MLSCVSVDICYMLNTENWNLEWEPRFTTRDLNPLIGTGPAEGYLILKLFNKTVKNYI